MQTKQKVVFHVDLPHKLVLILPKTNLYYIHENIFHLRFYLCLGSESTFVVFSPGRFFPGTSAQYSMKKRFTKDILGFSSNLHIS